MGLNPLVIVVIGEGLFLMDFGVVLYLFTS